MRYSHDPERSMLRAFAHALLEYARCAHCRTPLAPDFSPCRCGNKSLELCWLDDGGYSILHAEHGVWREVLEPLWNKDRRRVYGLTKKARRRQSIRESDEPSFTESDIACLEEAQGEACYYCGTSIHTGAQIEHLIPLAGGGSNGFANIMLACASCNASKHSLSERQFWTKLRKQLPVDEYDRRRSAAKEMKKAKWRHYREVVRYSLDQAKSKFTL